LPRSREARHSTDTDRFVTMTILFYIGLVVVMLPFIFAAFQITSLLFGWLNGWRALVACYPGRPVTKTRRIWAGVRMRFLVNDFAAFDARVEGLSVRGLPIYVVGHPPFLVPWSDLSFTESQLLLVRTMRIDFRLVPGVSMRVPLRTGERLRDLRNEALAGQLR
jgi:hypothetical protein